MVYATISTTLVVFSKFEQQNRRKIAAKNGVEIDAKRGVEKEQALHP